MTFKKLTKIIIDNNISEDVELQSDSGWECGETDMDGVYYNKKENLIIFTQEENEYQSYSRDKDFVGLNKKEVEE